MYKLPKNFTFGIAESDLQTVGSSFPIQYENASSTMWDDFTKKLKKDTPNKGSFKYNNIKEDISLINNLGVKAYRTSISMTRVIGKDGKPNKKALKWYRNYLSSLKKKNIQIHLCLYHWEAPNKFIEEGILHKDFHNYFLQHTNIVLEYLADLVDYYLPINELWCICYLAYYVGIHAPGYTDINRFFQSYFASITLQRDVILQIKESQPKSKIGIVNIHFPTYIRQNSDKKSYVEAQTIADEITNYIYSDPFYIGRMPQETIKRFKKYFPKDYKDIVSNCKLGDEIDYYGVNYYNGQYVKPSKNSIGFELDEDEIFMKNSLGWPILIPPESPPGLTDILHTYSQRYAQHGMKKIIVSENGTPAFTNESEIPQDNERIYYIDQHLKQIEKAIQKGVKVEGYFLWTLLDNYEWQEGYKPESAFGIVQVDRKTGKRTKKKSYYWYQSQLQSFYR